MEFFVSTNFNNRNSFFDKGFGSSFLWQDSIKLMVAMLKMDGRNEFGGNSRDFLRGQLRKREENSMTPGEMSILIGRHNNRSPGRKTSLGESVLSFFMSSFAIFRSSATKSVGIMKSCTWNPPDPRPPDPGMASDSKTPTTSDPLTPDPLDPRTAPDPWTPLHVPGTPWPWDPTPDSSDQRAP